MGQQTLRLRRAPGQPIRGLSFTPQSTAVPTYRCADARESRVQRLRHRGGDAKAPLTLPKATGAQVLGVAVYVVRRGAPQRPPRSDAETLRLLFGRNTCVEGAEAAGGGEATLGSPLKSPNRMAKVHPQPVMPEGDNQI